MSIQTKEIISTSSRNRALLLSFLLIVSVTVLIIFQLLNSKAIQEQLSQERVIQEAKAHFNNMVDTRSWNAKYGGVYVKANDSIQPNPYLKTDSHIYSENKELLVKINPAWMTRQISEISNQKRNYYYKITSLKPINPNNKPDNFEKEALEFFQKNSQEPYYYKFSEDLSQFNFMGSLKVKESCMQCHAFQGYKVGDIRGGIRVSTPTLLYQQEVLNLDNKTSLSFITIISFSILLLLFVIRFIINNHRHQVELELLNKGLEEKVQDRTQELQKAAQNFELLATTDSLTNVNNRYSIMRHLQSEITRAVRYNHDLAVILYDIDFFKKINDTHGHDVGDTVLVQMSHLIETSLRDVDIIGRYGGEEFIIILPETNLEDAKHIAERTRVLVEETTFANLDNTTISLGVTVLLDNEKMETLFKRLDTLLYRAKHSGRNQVRSLI